MHIFFFHFFSFLCLLFTFLVISSRNAIHSVIFLILVFCNATCLLLVLDIELLALMFIIIYVGAIAVLFLFVVMMLNIKVHPSSHFSSFRRVLSFFFLLFSVFAFFLFFRQDSLVSFHGSFFKSWSALIDPVLNIQSLGYLIYTYFFFHFFLASLILLVAMIGAVTLVVHHRRHSVKKQFIFQQVSRSFGRSLLHNFS